MCRAAAGACLSEWNDLLVVSTVVVSKKKRILEDRKLPITVFERIKGQQMPDSEKKKKADFIISTDQSISATEKDVERLVNEFSKISPKAWDKHYIN